MKSEKKISVAFVLNAVFSIFEFFGGMYTGSTAIISDSLHDIGDAASIGISYFLEKKSKKKPDEKYTYGYAGYSVIGGVITSAILLFGSVSVIHNAVSRILNPAEINYSGMIVFAVIGTIVNSVAVIFTRSGKSINHKAINLHMLEDVLNWVAILIGAITMKFTGVVFIDPIISVCIAIFISVNAVKSLKEAAEIFLWKTPHGLSTEEIQKNIKKIDGVIDVHHIHIKSFDGQNNYATMHIVTDRHPCEIKEKVRKELNAHSIFHSTLEFETKDELCNDKICSGNFAASHCHHHH